MIEALQAYLRDAGTRLLGKHDANSLRILKASGARAISAPVKLFVFCGAAAEPRLVCRVARHAHGEERLREEWEFRHELDARLSASLRRTVPAARALERLDGHLVLIEDGVPGRPLRSPQPRRFARHRRRVSSDLARVGAWLARFQEATALASQPWAASNEEAYVAEFFTNVGRWLQPTARRDVDAGLRRMLLPLRGAVVRWAVQHGDFWHGNVLANAGGVMVVDWEVARRSGPTFVDVLTFAFQYLFWQARDREGRIPAWLCRHVGAFVRGGVAPLGDDAAHLDAAFIVALLARCQLAGYGDGPPVALRVLLAVLRAPQSLDWLRG